MTTIAILAHIVVLAWACVYLAWHELGKWACAEPRVGIAPTPQPTTVRGRQQPAPTEGERH